MNRLAWTFAIICLLVGFFLSVWEALFFLFGGVLIYYSVKRKGEGKSFMPKTHITNSSDDDGLDELRQVWSKEMSEQS